MARALWSGERLKRVIQRKRKRQKIELPEQEKEPSPVPDLMAALERTLDNARAGRPLREEEEEPEPAGGK